MKSLGIIKKQSTAHTVELPFPEHYFLLQLVEKNTYADDEVAMLPMVNSTHPHYKRWMNRKTAVKKLVSHITRNRPSSNILEVGCGNGWLAALLAANTGGEVTGIDINTRELAQAIRVFGGIKNLNFIAGDFKKEIPADKKFDAIIFADSIQYFSSLRETIATALSHLTLLGEIHILDSRFYNQQEMPSVRKKMENYYSSQGIPEMTVHTFYHSLSELENFQYRLLYNPGRLINRLSLQASPYPWILIKNRYQ